MKETLWTCTVIICIVIMLMGYAVVKDITNFLRRIERLLDEISKRS